MTVGDLKAALENYDEDMPVCIGMIQSFGSNFATQLDDIDEFTVNDWEYGEEKKVVLTQGSQIGIVDYEQNSSKIEFCQEDRIMSKNIDKKLLEIGFKKKIKNENLYEYVRENEESKYIHKVDIAKKLISNEYVLYSYQTVSDRNIVVGLTVNEMKLFLEKMEEIENIK